MVEGLLGIHLEDGITAQTHGVSLSVLDITQYLILVLLLKQGGNTGLWLRRVVVNQQAFPACIDIVNQITIAEYQDGAEKREEKERDTKIQQGANDDFPIAEHRDAI